MEGGGEDLARRSVGNVLAEESEGCSEGFADAVLVERVEGEGSVALAELLAVRADDDGQVGVRRPGQVERLGESDLPRRRREQVCAAHDLRDSLFGVVHDDGELVGVGAVGSPHDEIADVAPDILNLRAKDGIVESDRTVGTRNRRERGARPAGSPSRQVPG